MVTRDVRTLREQLDCDVCGRTILRGERTDTYLAGASRRQVCELCTSRAQHEGWVREDARLERSTLPPGDRGRSLLGRLRSRRRLPEDADRHGASESHSEPRPAAQRTSPPPRASPATEPQPPWERRNVRAIPTESEHKVAAALELFNASEHPRTVAGVARSLGAPAVAARPSTERASLVSIAVAWELCWYRYEVELSDDRPTVRRSEQGYELSELTAEDLVANVAADEYGMLALALDGK